MSKRTGMAANVFLDTFNPDNIVTGPGTTEAGTKYFVVSKGEESSVPVPAGSFFQSPRGEAEQIQLAEGDRIFPIDPMRFCKTSASFEFSQGSVDVGDDCDPGATILDGIVTFTGSLAGLSRYDDETEEFEDVTSEIIGRFLDIM
ncbi:MAG: hypothetical protein FWC64_07025 [Treponema sp.]|nr:hypothetical protein [Treponema sp.]